MSNEALPAVPNLAVLLLLGGKSSRMGQPKHLLAHPRTRQPLYQHHLGTLTQLQKEGVFPEGVLVSGREEQREAMNLPESVEYIVDDPELNGDIGPASGILQAFSLKPAATWLLLAVDLPFLTRASILHLLSAHPPDSPVSLFLHPSDNNPEPLFSVWTPPALEQLRKNCQSGKSGPCRAAKDVWGGRIVEGKGGVKVLQENWVQDADTPDEWEKAVAALSSETSTLFPPTPPISPPPTAPSSRPFAPKRRVPIALSTAIDRIHALPLPSSTASSPLSRPFPIRSTSTTPIHSLVESVGCQSADDVRAVYPHPLDDNSAMDGYAVPSSLLSSASPLSPTLLPVLGRIVAGDSPPPLHAVESAGTRGCWEIMTGAVFPSEAFDAVVKVESTTPVKDVDELGRSLVRFNAAIRGGENRRKRGEQVGKGEVVLRRGERITPEKVLLLAAVGVQEVAVSSDDRTAVKRQWRVRVGVITTGKEVLPLSSFPPGVKPLPGQVIDCTTPYLSSLLLSRGFQPAFFSPSGDSASSFASSVSSALSPCDSSSDPPLDLLITTAGVSLGTTDHIPSTLTSLAGVSQVFHGVAVRPGAPVMLSLHTDSASGRTTPILSLPGNPMASAVGMRSFGCELLSLLLEGAEEKVSGWEAMELPPAGAGEEEAAAWEELAGRVKGGSTSFFALPLDEAKRRPTMLNAKGLKTRTSTCAMSSLVSGEAWVRIEALEDGGKSAKWCRF